MKKARLGRSILGTLKNSGKVSINEIAGEIGWTRKQVYDEIRRMKNMTILGFWITETNGKKDKYYELNAVARNGAEVDFLYEMADKTFKFNESIQERLK